jgi:hypothetical protein
MLKVQVSVICRLRMTSLCHLHLPLIYIISRTGAAICTAVVVA